MKRRKDEEKAVEIIINKLKNRGYKKIKTNVYLRREIGKKWDQQHGLPQPLFQPQIDVVLKGEDKYTINHLKKKKINSSTFENENLIRAIEVKRFTDKNRYSYYKGLDQAIAYLRFGFDAVALWHVFDEEVIKKNLEYAYRTWSFINELSLPLDFTPLILDGNDLYAVNTFIINNQLKIEKTFEIENPDFILMWRHPNPYSRKTEGLRIRTLINEWLENEK